MASLPYQPTDQDWENNRALLEDLYTRGTMRSVMDHMQNRCGWDVNIKRNQYHKWLTKVWKMQKNVDAANWVAIYLHVRDLQRGNRLVDVWIHGKKMLPQTIVKETRRQLRACPGLTGAAPVNLPSGVVVKACSFTPMEYITIELPFHHFENYLKNDHQIRNFNAHSVEIIQRHEAVHSGLWAPNHEVEKALQLVVPGLDDQFDFSLMRPNTRFFASPLHRSIMFSIANNFVGLDSFPKEQVILFLQDETSEGFYHMIRSAPQYYTTQAIALNLFRAGIEVGDVKTVESILRENLPGIGVNDFVCEHGSVKLTPIEAAAGLLHKELVKTLLNRGANLTLSHPKSDHNGALSCAAKGLASNWTHKRVAGLDQELFEWLVSRGGQLGSWDLLDLIRYDTERNLTEFIISFQAGENHERWTESGIFCAVFKIQKHSVMLKIFDVMLKVNANLGYRKRYIGVARFPGCIVDIIAQRGDGVLMQKLLENQVQLTGDTLPCAISIGSEDLVRWLLRHGADVSIMGDLLISPLAAAIRLQSSSMDELIIPQSICSLSKITMFESALRAASEIGSLRWIEKLSQIGTVRPADLGSALIIAIRNGKQDIALALLDAGADPNVEPDSGDEYPALLEALRKRDAALVYALLDADANPNKDRLTLDGFNGRESAIGLAVRWGDITIVQSIIKAGAELDTCGWRTMSRRNDSSPALNIAVRSKNLTLVKLLAEAGCDINNPRANLAKDTALKAAVESADFDMIRHVLSIGADVHDPPALAAAWTQGPQYLDLLLEAHKGRNPKGRPGWGSNILASALRLDDFDLFKRMMDIGADANQFDRSKTSFCKAIERHQTGGFRVVEYLLREKNKTGCGPESIVMTTPAPLRELGIPLVMLTAFLAAIRTKSRRLVDLMLRHNADIDFPAARGIKRTPLQQAAEVGSEGIVQLLLDRGAEVNGAAAQRGGATALQLAAIKGFIKLARLLLEQGAKVDAPASKVNGRTALEGAAEHGRLDMVVVLLRAGAALGGNDQAQIQRAIALAEENSHPHIARLLTRYGQTKIISSAEPALSDFEAVFDYSLYELN
ncbi:hypothetical protein VTL71DRAFT_9256 [Oculimacula yallundae]|uniref:Clr5 domain-containing protein n=1 Tax=Oculimacula yallundae TaxID=86028 RepID=A0ABR4BSN8_9HELO